MARKGVSWIPQAPPTSKPAPAWPQPTKAPTHKAWRSGIFRPLWAGVGPSTDEITAICQLKNNGIFRSLDPRRASTPTLWAGQLAPRAIKRLHQLHREKAEALGLEPGPACCGHSLETLVLPGEGGVQEELPLTCRLRPREEKAGMQQASVGHQNGALLFLSSSGHRQPGWFSSPAAKEGGGEAGRSARTTQAVSSPGSPGSSRRPQRPACTAA